MLHLIDLSWRISQHGSALSLQRQAAAGILLSVSHYDYCFFGHCISGGAWNVFRRILDGRLWHVPACFMLYYQFILCCNLGDDGISWYNNSPYCSIDCNEACMIAGLHFVGY